MQKCVKKQSVYETTPKTLADLCGLGGFLDFI